MKKTVPKLVVPAEVERDDRRRVAEVHRREQRDRDDIEPEPALDCPFDRHRGLNSGRIEQSRIRIVILAIRCALEGFHDLGRPERDRDFNRSRLGRVVGIFVGYIPRRAYEPSVIGKSRHRSTTALSADRH